MKMRLSILLIIFRPFTIHGTQAANKLSHATISCAILSDKFQLFPFFMSAPKTFLHVLQGLDIFLFPGDCMIRPAVLYFLVVFHLQRLCKKSWSCICFVTSHSLWQLPNRFVEYVFNRNYESPYPIYGCHCSHPCLHTTRLH